MIYTQQDLQHWNRLDDIGTLLDLKRNINESNSSYRQRILKVYVERAGAHYEGLINGMNNEFGLSRFMTISLESTFEQYDVTVTASRIILHSGDIYESYVYRYTRNDMYVECISLKALCVLINKSSYWSCSVESNIEEMLCDCLMIQTNNRDFKINVPATNRIILGKQNITTISFNERDTFKTEIPFNNTVSDPYDLLTVDGDYTIDYVNGVVYTKLLPRGYGIAVGSYLELPYMLVGTSCNVYSFEDEEFMNALYGEDYKISHNLYRYMRELFFESHQTWGK
jgi:hypothetical protein